MTPKEPETSLPLTEAVFFVLLSLAPQPKHGYAILKDVESLSGQRVVLSTGTLYGAIKRLLDQKWIEPVEAAQVDDEQTNSKRERKVYALTDLGRTVLRAEAQRMDELVKAAHLRLVQH